MRASFYRGDRTFETGTSPVPQAGPGEALLRIRRVGICGTDLHIFQGHMDHRVPRGGVIGHEMFAEVASAPAELGFSEGDRVVVEPLATCGECLACRVSGGYLCNRLKVIGVDLPGGMQEYLAVPAARLLKVPGSVDDDAAAVIEPLAVATHDVTRAKVKAADTVVVIGGGPIGTLIALVCRHKGARVKIAEINSHRLEMLRALGLDTIGPDQDVVSVVREWTNGDGADVSFEVSGDPAAARQVTEVVRVWGTVNVIGIHADPVPVSLYTVFARELTLIGSRLYTRAAWEEAIRLAASGAIPVGALVSRRVPLDRLQQAMEEVLAGGPVMKVLVDLD
jgi:2-desacetyl-2-hydroxyethyl bacteriochlorophyllide A dehydrogenase